MSFNKRKLYEKAKRKASTLFLNAIQHTPLQFAVYKSYWNYRFHTASGNPEMAARPAQYIAQKPNYSAGIGHQLANWNAGYYFSKYYHLNFAHFPFSSEKWEYLLGFGENEMNATAILKKKNIKKIRLPRFDCNKDVDLIGNIISSYKDIPAIFLLAQDQGYERQCDTFTDLSKKFFTAPARKNDTLFYKPGNFNIAIHIRRGDVAAMKANDAANWEQRWLNNNYYASILNQVLGVLAGNDKAQVYLFSQGSAEDFPEFDSFSNIHYCLDVNAYDSFVHMAHADLLISSKSSFSYKPALISKGIKICPEDFWHAYPLSADFILADTNGNFSQKKLAETLDSKWMARKNF